MLVGWLVTVFWGQSSVPDQFGRTSNLCAGIGNVGGNLGSSGREGVRRVAMT
jgi:hypothetical protein